jgi:hypothetical protein
VSGTASFDPNATFALSSTASATSDSSFEISTPVDIGFESTASSAFAADILRARTTDLTAETTTFLVATPVFNDIYGKSVGNAERKLIEVGSAEVD